MRSIYQISLLDGVMNLGSTVTPLNQKGKGVFVSRGGNIQRNEKPRKCEFQEFEILKDAQNDKFGCNVKDAQNDKFGCNVDCV